jgi:hypothetical protein
VQYCVHWRQHSITSGIKMLLSLVWSGSRVVCNLPKERW